MQAADDQARDRIPLITGEPETIGDLVELSARREPDSIALITRDGTDSRTYDELDRRSTRLANGLLGLGLEPGDRIAPWIEDCLEYVEIYLAAAKAGLIVAPINARFVAAEASFMLEDSGATALLWTPGISERIVDLDPDRVPRWTIGVRGAEGAGAALEDLIAAGDERRPEPPSPDDIAILGYTSGTTGRPKAAMLTHRNVVAVGRQNSVSYRLSAHSVIGLTGSMSFVSVVPAHVLCGIGIGARIVMMGHYDVAALIGVIEREGVTFTYVPSPLLREFAEVAAASPERVRSLNAAMHSASRADPAVLRQVFEAVGDRLVEGWGMTENSGGLATATTAADFAGPAAEAVFETVGRTAVGVSIKVIGEDGELLPHDGTAIGELAIRSPAQAVGYWNQPEASADTFVDGWFHSGDLGTVDAEGYVRIAERRTDLVISGGMNVYPSEVEQCISECPGVLEVGVVGLPHERWGQAVVAAVVREGSTPSAEEIIEHCRSRLASFKKPAQVIFVDELPYTPTLKLSRAALRKQLTDADD